jgi:hypothetical protein
VQFKAGKWIATLIFCCQKEINIYNFIFCKNYTWFAFLPVLDLVKHKSSSNCFAVFLKICG